MRYVVTKLRTPLSIEASLSFAISQDPEGAEICAATKKSLSWIRQCADPLAPASNIAMTHAADIAAWLEVTGTHNPFPAAFFAEVDRRVTEMGGVSKHNPQDPIERLAEACAGFGDIARAIHQARDEKSPAGTRFSACEQQAIHKAVQLARQFLDAIDRDVEEASKIVPLAS